MISLKKIGLLGGLSWLSTRTYYQVINETISKNLGGHHSADIIMRSLNFEPISIWMHEGNWVRIADSLALVVEDFEKTNVDFYLLCCNSAHKVASELQERYSTKLLHILEPTADKILDKKIKKIALLGTRFTMGDNFHHDYLSVNHGVEVIVPSALNQKIIHEIIFNELCHNIFKEKSRKKLMDVVRDLEKKGAEGLILGCTELGLLLSEANVNLNVFDTTLLHATKAAELSMNQTFSLNETGRHHIPDVIV